MGDSGDPLLDTMRGLTTVASLGIVLKQAWKLYDDLFKTECQHCFGTGKVICRHCHGTKNLRRRPAQRYDHLVEPDDFGMDENYQCIHCGDWTEDDWNRVGYDNDDINYDNWEEIRGNLAAAAVAKQLPTNFGLTAGLVACPECHGSKYYFRNSVDVKKLFGLGESIYMKLAVRMGQFQLGGMEERFGERPHEKQRLLEYPPQPPPFEKIYADEYEDQYERAFKKAVYGRDFPGRKIPAPLLAAYADRMDQGVEFVPEGDANLAPNNVLKLELPNDATRSEKKRLRKLAKEWQTYLFGDRDKAKAGKDKEKPGDDAYMRFYEASEKVKDFEDFQEKNRPENYYQLKAAAEERANRGLADIYEVSDDDDTLDHPNIVIPRVDDDDEGYTSEEERYVDVRRELPKTRTAAGGGGGGLEDDYGD